MKLFKKSCHSKLKFLLEVSKGKIFRKVQIFLRSDTGCFSLNIIRSMLKNLNSHGLFPIAKKYNNVDIRGQAPKPVGGGGLGQISEKF